MTSATEHDPHYRLEDRSVSIFEIPGWIWMSMIALFVLPLLIFWLIWPSRTSLDLGWSWLVWTTVLMLLHEGTHAVAWKFASGLPWSTFSFGFQWKTVTPYCHSAEPMPVRAYRIGAMMPLFVTGLVPWFVSLAMGHFELAIAGALLISGAGGDLYVLWSVRDLPAGVLLQDHDTRAGCIVLWPAD